MLCNVNELASTVLLGWVRAQTMVSSWAVSSAESWMTGPKQLHGANSFVLPESKTLPHMPLWLRVRARWCLWEPVTHKNLLFSFPLIEKFTWSIDEMTLSKAGYFHPFEEKNCWCNAGLQDLWGVLCGG